MEVKAVKVISSCENSKLPISGEDTLLASQLLLSVKKLKTLLLLLLLLLITMMPCQWNTVEAVEEDKEGADDEKCGGRLPAALKAAAPGHHDHLGGLSLQSSVGILAAAAAAATDVQTNGHHLFY